MGSWKRGTGCGMYKFKLTQHHAESELPALFILPSLFNQEPYTHWNKRATTIALTYQASTVFHVCHSSFFDIHSILSHAHQLVTKSGNPLELTSQNEIDLNCIVAFLWKTWNFQSSAHLSYVYKEVTTQSNGGMQPSIPCCEELLLLNWTHSTLKVSLALSGSKIMFVFIFLNARMLEKESHFSIPHRTSVQRARSMPS